jgi:hypothetical protein
MDFHTRGLDRYRRGHGNAAPRHGQVGLVGAVKLNMVVVITCGNYYNGEGYPFQLLERFSYRRFWNILDE